MHAIGILTLLLACDGGEIEDTGKGGDDTADTGAADTADSGDTDTGDTDTADTGDTDDSGDTGDTDTGVPDAWAAPACTSVTGTGAVTFTSDAGATLAPTDERLSTTVYTFGLVAFADVPGKLLAAASGQLLASDDAGCTWTEGEAVAADNLFKLEATAGGVAWGWADNGTTLVRIAADGTVTPVRNDLTMLGFWADPADADHARFGDGDGVIWETTDGATFAPIGLAPAGTDALGYRVAFDPVNPDHALFGTAVNGAYVTFDGGATWASATGFAEAGRPANVFQLVVSPVDTGVVWAQGIDLDATETPISEGRHLWRSDDGGLTFRSVAEQSETLILVNGPPMFADAADADVVWFTFGTYYDAYGTDLYRYDHAAGAVTSTHNAYDDVVAVAFSPADPAILYLGVAEERVSVQ